VNFEVTSCTKFQVFRGCAPDPAGELTVLSQTPSWWGGAQSPPQEPHPCSWPLGSEKVLENFSWGPGKVLDFLSVKEWEPCL